MEIRVFPNVSLATTQPRPADQDPASISGRGPADLNGAALCAISGLPVAPHIGSRRLRHPKTDR
jgi:hypothetical protein